MANQTNVDSTAKETKRESYTVNMGAFDIEDYLEIVLPPESSISFSNNDRENTYTLSTKVGRYNKKLDKKGNVIKRVSTDGHVLSDDTLKGHEH